MSRIQVTADFNKAIDELGRLNASLDLTDDRIQKVTSTVNKYNAAGQITGSVIKGLTTDGKTFTATMEGLNRALSQQRMGISFKEVASDTQKLKDETTGLERGMLRLGRSMQYFVTYRAFSAITDGIKEGISAANDLAIKISLIRTISQGNQQGFNKTLQDVRGVSDRTGFNPNDTAKAFYDITSNQIAKGADVGPIVQKAAEFARVTGSDVTDSVNLLSSAINSFGKSAGDTDQILAVMFKTIDEGRIVASEVANTLGRVGVVATNLGVSYEEVAATLAITTQKGFTTSDAMTLLTNLMTKLEKPTQATAAFFKSLGVDTGEAAIKLYGFTGVLNKMVEATKSGQVDVSAFFDEIRGRKQFGIFEQSIGGIDDLAKRMKNTAQLAKEYQTAVDIRGESPADYLNKEANKLGNIFKVDIGDKLLGSLAAVTKFAGGVENLGGVFTFVGSTASTLALAIGALGAAMLVTKGYMIATTTTATAFGASLSAAVPAVLAFVAAYKGLEYTMRIDVVKGFDSTKLSGLVGEVERLKKLQTDSKATQQGMFDAAKVDSVGQSYRKVGSLIAQAVVLNEKLTDSTRATAKAAAENLTVGFEKFKSSLQSGLQDMKSKVTDIKREIDGLAKSKAVFGKSLDDLLFSTQMEYANDDVNDQKMKLTSSRIRKLSGDADTAYAKGTPESVEEARKIYDEIAKLEKDNFDRRVAQQKKNAEYNGFVGVWQVNTYSLELKLANLKDERDKKELMYGKTLQKNLEIQQKGVLSEEDKINKLEVAFKKLTDLSPFNAQGNLKGEYKDPVSGKFMDKKYATDLDAAAAGVSKLSGGDVQARIAVEDLVTNYKKARIAEAGAAERSELLKTKQTQMLNAEERLKGELKAAVDLEVSLKARQKELRDKTLGRPGEGGEGYGNLLRGFAQNLQDQTGTDRFTDKINERIAKFEQNQKDPKVSGDALREEFKQIMELMRGLLAAETGKPNGNLTAKDADGKSINIGQAFDLFQSLSRELEKLPNKIVEAQTTQRAIQGEAEIAAKNAEKLVNQFPELAQAARDANNLATSMSTLEKEAITPLIKAFKELGAVVVPKADAPTLKGKIGLADGLDAVYAASGGVVGQFPGQPKGVDQYPIWAAAGETIIDAQSSKMFRPVLDAIRSRRVGYFSQGGVVGGDTNVGDVTNNITVNGATTNTGTASVIAKTVERLQRRNQINLKRK